LEGVAMEDVGIFYDHFIRFMAIWHILRIFGLFEGNLVYLTRFGKLKQEKSGIPGTHNDNAY
jgi:hypothetical protein